MSSTATPRYNDGRIQTKGSFPTWVSIGSLDNESSSGFESREIEGADNSMAIEIESGKTSDLIELLLSFATLETGWNGGSALPIPKTVINRSIDLLNEIDTTPEVFPTGRESIQFEIDFENVAIEVEVFANRYECLLDVEGSYEEIEFEDQSSTVSHVRKFIESYQNQR